MVNGDKTSETKIIGETGTVVAGGMECEAVFGGSGAFCANARYMTLENVNIDSGSRAGKSSGSMINSPNVTFRNVNLYGDFVNLNIDGGANYFTWQGGSHGQDGVNGMPRGCDKSHGQPVWVFASNATLDGIRFNPKKILAGTPGQYCGTDNTPHLETIRTESDGTNLTVKNSWFTPGSDAGSGHIFTSTGAQGLKLINNVFDPVNGSYAIQAGSSACDWTLLYNTFTQGLSLGCTSGFTTVGNLGVSNPSCSGTHFKNVWQGTNNGTACSGTDKTFSNLGIGTAGHLNSTSPAINAAEAGTGSDYCVGALVESRDYEGNTRPFGGACDAGASEYGSTSGGGDTTPPETTITSSAIGSTTSTSANFTFTSNESGSTFECKLDSGSYSSCTSPKAYTGLSIGSHTFTVRATDSSNNTDTTPTTQTWTITTPPTTKPGDTNGDNVVNVIDLSTLLSKWNTSFPNADFNSDGTVGIVDLSVLLSNYGK
jgi:hypothetical protein